jgi:hypothetical protein
MIREGLYRLLGRWKERYAFFVPNYVRTLNWEVLPLNDRKIDSFDRWLERTCPYRVGVAHERAREADSWLTIRATNFWGIHHGEGNDGRAFWASATSDGRPRVNFYLRDPDMAVEFKMNFG